MKKIMIFGGTKEGRNLTEFCQCYKIPVVVSVATEYGEELLHEDAATKVVCGRKEKDQIIELLKNEDISFVIDATHPYAKEVSKNVSLACREIEKNYIRLVRESIDQTDLQIIHASSVKEAAQYLKSTTGNVMLTTGSKELAEFVQFQADTGRFYPRVLPSIESIQKCIDAGYEKKNIIAIQGPFSEELNAALINQYQCRFLVTKDTGSAGGFAEKMDACKKTGCKVVVIARPAEETGKTYKELCEMIKKTYHITEDMENKISVIGIGMGNCQGLTLEAANRIEKADVLIGASRILHDYKDSKKRLYSEYAADKIKNIIDQEIAQNSDTKIAVLMSGDVGFYSGAKKLIEILNHDTVELLPGISSAVYFSAKIAVPWQDMIFSSVHGRKENVIAKIQNNRKVFLIAGKWTDLTDTAKTLINLGTENMEVYTGENLSYPDEKIWHGTIEELVDREGSDLCTAVFINHHQSCTELKLGIPDEEFLRDKVPMTKEEIRILSIAKMRLTKDAVVYDIGAGTGSVSIECANIAENGKVYAIEKKEAAVRLIEKNKEKFGLSNIEIVNGTAPEALEGLENPTHAFVGGSSGNLKEILRNLFEKNSRLRVVVNAISLETISEITELSKEYKTEMIQVSIGKSEKIGNYHLMKGQNPVMIAVIERKF